MCSLLLRMEKFIICLKRKRNEAKEPSRPSRSGGFRTSIDLCIHINADAGFQFDGDVVIPDSDLLDPASQEQWTERLQSENLLEGYRAEKFIEYTDGAEPLTEMDTDFMLKTLDHIKVFEDGTLLVVFLDGTEIECKNEEE